MTAVGAAPAVPRSRWLPLRSAADRDGLPLFCLPHAGGGASAFRTWLDRLPGVAVLPVPPPGREARIRETPHQHMESLVAELATVVLGEPAVRAGRPYAVYGHSLGALVAFELVREIRRRGGPEPVRLAVSGCVAPQYATGTDGDGPPVAGMTDQEVVRMLRRLGGTPEWLLADPGVLAMILPAIRADFSVKETYEYRSEAPLGLPVTVLASTEDPRAAESMQVAWRDQTLGAFDLHTLVGGHFAVFDQADRTHHILGEALRHRA